MNFKKFMTLIVVLMTVALFSNSVLAQTFYVDNAAGNDANSGTAPGAGNAKQSLGSALIAAPLGSTISIKYTGIVYAETLPTTSAPQTYGTVPPITLSGIAGTYTITSTGGTPEFTSTFQVGVGTVAGTKGTITFAGPVQFDGGLNLTNGTLAGGNFVTVKGTVYRTELGSITSGQLNYIGTVNLLYETALAAATITTGLEFPTSGTVAGNLFTQPTHGALTLTLNQSAQFSGQLFTDALGSTTSAPLNLGTYTLTLNNTTVAVAHSVRSDVTNGTLAFSTTTGGASINSPAVSAKLPNITATTDKLADAALLTIGANISTIGNITASLGASIYSSNSGAVGNVTLNGNGTIQTFAQVGSGNAAPYTSMAGAVVAAAGSTGNIYFQNIGPASSYQLTSITESGMGQISFNSNINAVKVTGNVLLNTAFTYVLGATTTPVNTPTISKAWIVFPSTPVTIGGTLTNSASFAGNTDLANTSNGQIIFQAGTVTVTGLTTNSATGTVTYTTAGVGTSNINQGDIDFYNGANAITLAGVTNSAALSSGTGFGGRIISTGTGAVTAGAILNSSIYAGANIDFSTSTLGFTSASLTESGTVLGGKILIGNETATTGNITNSRTVAGSDINIGTAGTAGVAVTAGTVTVSGKSNVNFNSTLSDILGPPVVSGLVKAASLTVTATADVAAGIFFPFVTTANFQIVNITQAGGLITFNPVNTSTFTITTWNITNGTISFGNGTGPVLGAATPSTWTWSAGTIDFGTAARLVTFNGSSLQIGDLTTKVLFNNSNAAILDIEQFYPNGIQSIKLGLLDQQWPGSVNVGNGALIPAPYVVFQSVSTSGAVGNLYILNKGLAANGLTFNTGGTVLNTVELNGVAIYVGKNDVPTVNGGNFQNTTGYVSINSGYIYMASGVGGQFVNTVPATAGATFGNLGFTALNVPGNTVTISTSITLSDPLVSGVQTSSDLRLATGSVIGAGNITFTGVTTAPWPTIYRTEGKFDTYPIVSAGSRINVTYYGNDKTASFEIPAPTGLNATPLSDLHVATTNGAKNGYGIVQLALATIVTVNGTLTIDANQTLQTGASTLILAGPSVSILGYLVDDGFTRVQLASPTGVSFTGTGVLPNIQVNDGSDANRITGYVGLYSGYLGANLIWGTDDYTGVPNGNITFAAGANKSALTVNFTNTGKPNFGSLLMNAGTGAKHYFTVSSPAIMSGTFDLEGGVVAINGTKASPSSLTLLGSSFTINGTTANGSKITTTNGNLIFSNPSSIIATTADATPVPVVISANTIFNGDPLNASNFIYTVNSTNTDNIYFTNLVTINNSADGTSKGASIQIGGGQTLIIGGNTLTLASLATFTTDLANTGILKLTNSATYNPSLPLANVLTVIVGSANNSVVNLVVDGNVTLSSTLTTGTLSVSNSFLLNSGDLNLTAFNLAITGAGSFTVNGGYFDATSAGYLIWGSTNAAGFNYSALTATGPFTINNFMTTTNLNLTPAFAKNFNVIQNLWLNGGSIFNSTGAPAAGYIHVGNATTIPLITVNGTSTITGFALQFDNASTGKANYKFTGSGGLNPASTPISALYWPVDATSNAIANNVEVALTIAPPATVNLISTAANRTINGNLTLTSGQFVIPAGVIVTLANATTIITRTVDGSIIALPLAGSTPAGKLTTFKVNLVYLTGGASGDFSTSAISGSGIEYSAPTTIVNITVGKIPVPNPVTGSVVITLNTARTITGLFAINGTLTMPATTITASQNVTTGAIVMTALLKINTQPSGYTYFNNLTGPVYSNDSLGIGSYTANSIVDPSLTMAAKRNVTFGSISGTGNLLIGTANQNGNQSSITITGTSTLNGTIKVTGNVNLKTGASIASTTNLRFIGSANAFLQIVSSVTIGQLTLDKTQGTNLVTIATPLFVQPFDVTTSGNPSVTFINGLFVTGNNTLYISAPLFGSGIAGGQGFDRSQMLQGNVSHIVGYVGKKIVSSGLSQQLNSSEPRQEFPVGTIQSVDGTTPAYYRPAAVTFLPTSFGVSTVPNVTLVVSHQSAVPAGTVGLPTTDGAVSIGNKASFYWTIASKGVNVNLSFPVNFELTAAGFTSQPPVDFKQERIISRFGGIQDSTNAWSTVQGTVYANELNTMTVIQEGMVPTWRTMGAIYTIGSTSVLAMTNPPSAINVAKPNGPISVALSNSFSNVLGTINYSLAAVSDTTIATVSVSRLVGGSFLNITPLATGTTNLTMQAVDVNATTGTVYGIVTYTIPVKVGITGVVTTDKLPTEFALFQNYPNPFNPTTMIKFDLPKETNVKLKVYNILGAEVATLVNNVMPAGHQSVAFNASRFASGMYIYRIEAGNFVQVKKMILMK